MAPHLDRKWRKETPTPKTSGAIPTNALSFGIKKCARPLVGFAETATAILTVVWGLGGVGLFEKLWIQISFKVS